MDVQATDMVMLLGGLGFFLMVTLKSPASAPLVVRKVFLSPSIPISLSLLALPWNGCLLFCMSYARIFEFQANLFCFRDNMVLDFLHVGFV